MITFSENKYLLQHLHQYLHYFLHKQYTSHHFHQFVQ